MGITPGKLSVEVIVVACAWAKGGGLYQAEPHTLKTANEILSKLGHCRITRYVVQGNKTRLLGNLRQHMPLSK